MPYISSPNPFFLTYSLCFLQTNSFRSMGTMWNLNKDAENPFLPIMQLPPLDFTSGDGYYDLCCSSNFLLDTVPVKEYYPNNDFCTMKLEPLLPISELPSVDFTSLATHQSIQQSQLEKNIDVDQLVEQNKSTCTPQSSMSKLTPISPSIDESNYVVHDETCLPPELCSICSHGFKLMNFPEAKCHLREIKDMLITISNELLDNFNDLSPAYLEKLRQKRLELKKQIQQFEQYHRPNSAEWISKEVLSQYYYMPILEAAKELNVGETFLKKRCRELGIKRWPRRKLMSLQTVIKNVQELGNKEGAENELKLKGVIELLEREMKLVEENPDYQLDDTTYRLRGICFKANWKKRKLMKMMESIYH